MNFLILALVALALVVTLPLIIFLICEALYIYKAKKAYKPYLLFDGTMSDNPVEYDPEGEH